MIFNNKKLFTLAEKDVSYIKKYYKEINEKLKQINNEIKIGNLSIDKEVKKHIRDLSDSLDFLNEINKEMIFAYIPIRSITKGEKGTISILKKRRGNFEKDDKLNVFINLHMEYLNKVKIYFEAVGNLINIKFNIKEENIGLFKENETRLSNALKNNGYKLNSISYIEDKDISFLDTLIDNHNSYYYLDVRV